MSQYRINITENLHSTIEDLQDDDCELARRRVEFLDSLLTQLVGGHLDICNDDASKLKLINTLTQMKLEYLSFIPGWTPGVKF